MSNRHSKFEVKRSDVKLTQNENVNKKAELSLTNPARRESLPKLAPIRHAYNVVADNTGLSSFV